MKKINVYFSFMVLAIFALGACTSSSSDDMSNSDLGEVLSGGDNWVVSYFVLDIMAYRLPPFVYSFRCV